MSGKKFDKGKLRWDLIPFDILDELVSVLTYGAFKYNDNNWQGVESNRYQAALMRHISKYMQGEKNDTESKIHHLAHAMCNCMFLLWKERHDGKDKTKRK